jgi:hypothetical protein
MFENRVPRSLCHAFAPGIRIPLYSAGMRAKAMQYFSERHRIRAVAADIASARAEE